MQLFFVKFFVTQVWWLTSVSFERILNLYSQSRLKKLELLARLK